MDINEKIEKHLSEASDKTAKADDFDKRVRLIDKMTNENDHNGARVAAAALVNQYAKKKNKYFSDIYQSIQSIHLAAKSMHPLLLKYRDAIDDQFFEYVEKELGEAMADKLHGAF